MQYAEFPILSLIILSPVLGIALAGVFRDASDGVPAKVAALSSSLLTFLLSLYLWFNFDASSDGLQLVERVAWIPQFNIEYFLGLDGLNLFFLLIITFISPLALLGSWNLKKRNWQFQIQMLLLEIGMLGCFAAGAGCTRQEARKRTRMSFCMVWTWEYGGVWRNVARNCTWPSESHHLVPDTDEFSLRSPC